MIAKMYYSRSMGVAIGFPAFDSRQQLVGFYSEQKVGARDTYCVHPRVSARGPRQGDTTAASDILNEEIEQRAERPHAQCVQNNLEKLKENVMMYYWSKGCRVRSQTGRDMILGVILT